MSTITTQAGTQIYKDWGEGQPLLVENATLKVYEGGLHGLADTHKDWLNADLLALLRERDSLARRINHEYLQRNRTMMKPGIAW